MILLALLAVMLIGAVAAWFFAPWNPIAPRWIAVLTLSLESLLTWLLWLQAKATPDLAAAWFADLYLPWIPRFGIAFHLAMDGLSLLLVAMTVLLGFMAISASWTEIKHKPGCYYFNLLLCLAGTLGVFLAADLILFFFCWELMIIPMYFLISIWGHENRGYAALKFVIFTQAGSLLLLLAIVVFALLLHDQGGGAHAFDYFAWLDAELEPELEFWLMLGFLIPFCVKLPVMPFHTWLADAHTQAPTGASIILAGVMLKTGAYGLLRFVIPLFPQAAGEVAPLAMLLGACSVIYGATLAIAQTDLKRLIAYTSISHMGFILLGVFAWNLYALQGAVVTMLAHGVSAAALFMLAGALQQRLHTRELTEMGGLWTPLPKLAAFSLFFALAALGLPGLGNFIGEFLVLLGAFNVNRQVTAVTALALILAPVYAFNMIQKAFHGPQTQQFACADCSPREWLALGILALAAVWLGLGSQAILDLADFPLRLEMQYTFELAQR
jgi:NADH-quinone oxidoreductase subunit M